jgi:hypothetical protein
LNDADAKFLLVGGHAVGFYGVPRATKDIDIWVEPSPDKGATTAPDTVAMVHGALPKTPSASPT